MRGFGQHWMIAGLRRNPGPVIGTLVAVTAAATMTVAAASVAGAHVPDPPGRLASASVVVAGRTELDVTIGSGQNAQRESEPLPVYRGVEASLAQRLALVPGAASAVGESGFPGGVVQPGEVDLIAVTARPGVAPGLLASRIARALRGGKGYTIATGAARGDLANLSIPVERANGQALAGAIVPPLILIAMFVLAGTAALSVSVRWRRFALIRALGATRGQVRRAILGELALLGVVGGALGCVSGAALAALAARAFAAHQLLPAGSTAWLSPWLLLISCGSSVITAALGGWFAARRAGRTSPAQALRESRTDRKWPHPVRVLLGLGAAGGAGTLTVFLLSQKEPEDQLGLALPLLLACMVAIALLGPLLVALTAFLSRPLRRIGGPAARMALAAIAAQPRRTASAVIPVALAVAMVGSVYFANQSIAHATAVQAAETVTATHVLSGNGLTSATLQQAQALHEVRAAAGLAPLTVGATDPGLEQVYGETVAGGPLTQVLNLSVASGSLSTLAPGQIAVSALEASAGAMGVRVGSRVTVYLPDGTPYRATVSAVYSRSLAVGDVLIPAAVTAGHTGTAPGFSEILVSGGSAHDLATFTAEHPGTRVQSPLVYNEQSDQASAQNSFANDLILGVIALLAAVALVNTLAMTTFSRRRLIMLLGRVGATRGQVAATFGWQALFVAVTGIVAGVAAGLVTLLAVTRAVTGTWAPFIAPGAAAVLIAAVTALTMGATLIPFGTMARTEPALATG